jgi:hypothetical protein
MLPEKEKPSRDNKNAPGDQSSCPTPPTSRAKFDKRHDAEQDVRVLLSGAQGEASDGDLCWFSGAAGSPSLASNSALASRSRSLLFLPAWWAVTDSVDPAMLRLKRRHVTLNN